MKKTYKEKKNLKLITTLWKLSLYGLISFSSDHFINVLSYLKTIFFPFHQKFFSNILQWTKANNQSSRTS